MCAETNERDFRLSAIGDIGGRVQRDRIPNDIDFRLRIAVCMQEPARSIGAIDFEALVCGVMLGQAEIVEQRSEIQQLAIVLHLPLFFR